MADVYHADLLALLFSVLGGFFMGAYPVPIKAPRVLKVNPHPIIFQCYKTFWVFLTGWIFVLWNLVSGKPLIFEFSWWGVVSGLAWVPSGLSTIASVPRLGVGLAIAISTGTASVLSFLVFWLVLGEKMKEHMIDGHEIAIAPIYLLCILAGMVSLVAAPGVLKRQGAQAQQPDQGLNTQLSQNGSSQTLDDFQRPSTPEKVRTTLTGLCFACLAGVMSAVQFGSVNLGKDAAQSADGCSGDMSKCSDVLKEQFNNFGSWEASFGIGALIATGGYLAVFYSLAIAQKRPLPEFHFEALRFPGSLAGLLWVLGNFFQLAAVVRGGAAVMVPANQGIQLVTSGAFGLFYYWEVPDRRRMLAWIVAALWTLTFIIFLSREKAS